MRRVHFVGIILFLLACAGGISQRSEPRRSMLIVHNDWQQQITVYVAHDGMPTRRLGEVEMKGSRSFILEWADMPNESLQLFVQDRLSGLRVFTEVLNTGAQESYALSFGPLPMQVFLYPTR